MVRRLRNGKYYSSAEEPEEYIVLSSSTMKSTQNDGERADRDEGSVVPDSEVEIVSRPDDVPERDAFRMPVLTDAGVNSPLPALYAEDDEMVDTGRAIFAPEIFNYDQDDIIETAAERPRNLAEGSAMLTEHVTNDGAVHLGTQNEQSPEPNKETSRESGSFVDYSTGSLLDHDAQPREMSVDPMELSEPDKEPEDVSLKEMYGTDLNAKTLKLIDRVESTEKRPDKDVRKVHLMVSGRNDRDQRKRPREERESAEDNNTYSSYDLKGKSRELGTRPDESAQIELDRLLAEKEQERLYREAGVDTKTRNPKRPAKGNPKPKKKGTKNKTRSKSHLDLTQWIETPSPAPESKAPEASPVRALRQLPTGGYLAQAWTEAPNNKKKSAGHRISKHTQKRIKRNRNQLEDWYEGSDISDSEPKKESPAEPPPSYESSSPSSSSTSNTSSSDTSTSVEESDATIGTSDSESEENDAHARSRSHSAHRKSSKGRVERKNLLSKTIKYPEPATYDGRAHLETFETFVFEYKNWIKVNRLPEKYQIIAMKRFLTDKAGAHYMTFAAVNLKKWTVDNYLRALFNHCFPIHFRSQMRAKFNRCVQGGRSTREFLRELRTLGNRLPDIGDVQIRLQFWEGSNPYLRVEWAKAGLDPETSSLTELELAAERFEMAETLRKNEDKRSYKAVGSSSAVSNADKYKPKKRDRSKRYEPKRWRRTKWRRNMSSAGSTNSESLSAKKPHAGTRNVETRVKREKITNKKKDELRAGNQCFHCEKPGHFAKDCPTKKTIRPAAGAISLTELDSLHTTVNKISLFAMTPKYDASSESEREGTAPSLNGKRTTHIPEERSTNNEPCPELVKNIYLMKVSRKEAVRILMLTYRICDQLNRSVSKQEEELLKPTGFTGERRYEDYYRIHGRSFVIMDAYAERGIEIQSDTQRSIEEIVTLIRQRQFLDACRGTLNGDQTLSRILKRVEKILEDPSNMLVLPFQGSKSFQARTTDNPDYIAIEDLRLFPSRKGDARPLYWVRISWLFCNWNLALYIWWCSSVYDKIREGLYDAVPLLKEQPNQRTRIFGSRFRISMGEPEVWHIYDRAFEKKSYLWTCQANNSEFDVTQWYVFEFSICDYNSVQYKHITSTYWDENPIDHEPSAERPLTPVDDAKNPNSGERKFKKLPSRLVQTVEVKREGKSDSYSEYEKARLRQRSPRPYSNGPNRSRGLLEDGTRQESAHDSNNDSDMPSLVNVSSAGITDDDGLEVARTINQDSSDETMDDASDWVDEPDEPKLERFDSAKYRASQPDPPSLAPSVLASLHMVRSRVPPSVRKGKLMKPGTSISALERHAARIKDFERIVPHPIVIEVLVDGRAVHALVDTGSLADFISTRLIDQLKLPVHNLNKPLPVQLATAGSRTVVRHSANVRFEYQGINEMRRFDVINANEYGIILGTPFLYQYKVALGFNPSQIAIGTKRAAPIVGMQVAVIPSKAADVLEGQLETLRKQLQEEARDLCKDISESPLPPLRAVNHTIPLIDESKIYPYRPSKCPDAMRPLWKEKKDQYIKNGRWRLSTGSNASPLLILWKPKPGPDGKPRIRTVVDKRIQNANTKKMSSPLPDMEVMLRNAAKHKYRSLIDGKDAYEQIRVVPEHVHRTLFNTPDGTMESLVLQQGDCNGGATYQALMNHIFAPYIGVFMDVYLDDILIYSDTIEDHIKHIRIVLDILRKEKLYLSWDKMKLFSRELVLLGHVITDQGIKMDPHKVDAIEKWKTPTSRELLLAFLGSVGYLANGVRNIRIPMAALTPLTGSKRPFKWGPIEQRAFEEVKSLVSEYRNHCRTNIDESNNAPPINVTSDACLTGAGGHLSQGEKIETARNIAFWSGKFNSAQQNYPTHERELLAIVESLKRFKPLIFGRRFRIFTDHEALEHLMKQKNLSHRQARWVEELNDYDFEIVYIPGKVNKFADALSRIYSHDQKGTVRAKSEFVSDIHETNNLVALNTVTLRSGEPMTLDTGPSVFQRIGLTGKAVKPVVVDPNDAKGSAGRKSTENDKEGDKPIKDKSNSGKEDARQDDADDYDSIAYSDKDNDKEGLSDESEELVPAELVPTTRYGRVVRPTKRKDYDYEEKHNHKKKSSVRMPESEEKRISKPLTIRLRFGKRQDSTRELEGESSSEPTVESRESEKGPPDNLVEPSRPEERGNDLLEKELERLRGDDPEETNTLAESNSERSSDPEPITTLISNAEGINLYDHIKGNYQNDKLFKLIINSPSEYRNFLYENDLLYLRINGSEKKLCIPDVMVGKRRLREIIITHAHTILAHLGARKTIQYLREHVWWKGMIVDANNFCDTCSVCNSVKARTTKPYGLLQTLEIATRPWQSIGIDFVGPLPSSTNRNVPTNQKYRAKHVAEVVFDSVYKLHGLPERIVSDRDTLFTSIFWSHLHKLIGVELKMSTAYHPQTDGATERANKTMVQMLRQCISPDQKNWAIKLPAIEFAMNSARSETTGFSPFFLNYGRLPGPMIWDHDSEYPGVREFALRMKEAIMTAHDAVIAARVQQTHYANRHRRQSEFLEGDLVYLSTENLNLPKGRSRKLAPRYIGPYKIIKVKSPGASYELELPIELQRRGVHPVFHASLLRPHIPNDDRRFPGRDLKQVSAFGRAPKEYMIDKIVSHYGKGKDALFKVAWTSGDTTWMTHLDVVRADVLKPYCEAMGVASVDSLPKGRENPPDDIKIECGMVSFEGIRRGTTSTWNSPSNHHNDSSSTYLSINNLSMNIQFTDSELADFRQYDTNRAVRLVADDEGKNFHEIIPKPTGYDDWANGDDSVSVARWVSDKKNQTELDVNEIGRRFLKRALFQGMASSPTMGAGRPRNNFRRALANKAMGTPLGYFRPGTPYPKINGVPLVAGPGGTLQLAQVGGRPAAYPLPDAGSSKPFTTPADEYRRDAIISENSRLRREIEELRSREGVVSRLGQASSVNNDTSNEVGLNIMGLTVSDPPIARPVARKNFIVEEDESMMGG